MSAIRSAFSLCRSMRTASVLMPRSTSQESKGPATAPIAFWWYASSSPSSSSAVTISAPPTTSEWPPMYLVGECTTTSAPSASGCWR